MAQEGLVEGGGGQLFLKEVPKREDEELVGVGRGLKTSSLKNRGGETKGHDVGEEKCFTCNWGRKGKLILGGGGLSFLHG